MKEKLLDSSKLYYLSHPFTSFGDRNGNLKDANIIELHLRIRHKAKVINPIALMPEDTSDETAMIKCFYMYQASDAVVFCENWEKSTGCLEEHAWAKRDGKEIYYCINNKVYKEPQLT